MFFKGCPEDDGTCNELERILLDKPLGKRSFGKPRTWQK
jgi:hypothetical protein